jgi:hypothetical protein
MNIINKIKDLATDTKSGSQPTVEWYITAERGEGIRDEDFIGRSDPYLKIQFGGRHFKTRSLKNDRSPFWNETFNCKVNDTSAGDIHLALMDDDIGFDDAIGKAIVSKEELPTYSGEEKSIRVPLLRKDQVTGIVYLRVKKIIDGQGPMQSYQGSNVNSQQFQQPPYNTGYQQQYTTGVQQPPMMYDGLYNNSGQSYNQPQFTQGTQPQFTQGTQPQFTQGTQPQFTQGTQPQFSQGTQPQYNQGLTSSSTTTTTDQQHHHHHHQEERQQQLSNLNQGNVNYYGSQQRF